MPQHRTSITVAAPVEDVWAVTRDIEAWPSWNPTTTRIVRPDAGPLVAGSTAKVWQPKLRPATWTVDEVVENRVFTWHTKGFGYQITAEHHLTATPNGTAVELATVITGPMGRVIWAVAGRVVRRYVDQEAAALRARCEAP